MKYTSAMDSIRPSIGHIAFQWLTNCTEVHVQGVTSSGIFLQLQDFRIIFLTEWPDFGPLNIVLNQRLPKRWQLHDEIKVQLSSQEISLIHSSGQLKITQYEIWQIPPAPAIHILRDEQINRINLSVSQINAIKGDNGFSQYLPLLMKPVDHLPYVDSVLDHMLNIRNALIRLDTKTLLKHAWAITGYGRGLTPSGDDLLCGILFFLNRWRFENIPVAWVEKINQELFKHARIKTTSASNSLLYCAIQGSADYRIQQLSDSLVNESIPFQRQAMQLARWGSSSGADIFAGILITIQAMFNLYESGSLNAKA